MSTHPNLAPDSRDVPQNNEDLFSRTAQLAGEKMSREAQTIPQAFATTSKLDESKGMIDFSKDDIYKPASVKAAGGDEAQNPAGTDGLVGQTRPGDTQPAPTAGNGGDVGQTNGDVGQTNGDAPQVQTPTHPTEVKPAHKPAPEAHAPHGQTPGHDSHAPHGQKPAPAAEIIPTTVTRDNNYNTSAALLSGF